MKTTFKLSAVALALVATGAIASPDWTLGTPSVDRTLGQFSGGHHTAAHAAGWKGQGQVIFTMITNVDNGAPDHEPLNPTSWFVSYMTGNAAPLARLVDNGNKYVANAPMSYTAFITREGNTNPGASMSGVSVNADVPVAGVKATHVVSSRTATIDNNGAAVANAPSATDVSFTVHGIESGSNSSTGVHPRNSIPYLASSAAIIQSKFVNLTNTQVVSYMAAGVTGPDDNRKFSLGTTLAPRSIGGLVNNPIAPAPTEAWENMHTSPEVRAKYGVYSDVAQAHLFGWKGQGYSVVTKTTDTTKAIAQNFGTKVELIAPRVEHVFLGNTAANGSSMNISNSVFSGFVTTEDKMEEYISNPAVAATGITIIGSDSTNRVAVGTGTYKGTALAHDGLTPVISFDKVDATIKGNAINGIQEKTAYIVGATAIIQSKFANLSNAEVVARMDTSRTVTGAFSLGGTLAPRKAF